MTDFTYLFSKQTKIRIQITHFCILMLLFYNILVSILLSLATDINKILSKINLVSTIYIYNEYKTCHMTCNIILGFIVYYYSCSTTNSISEETASHVYILPVFLILKATVK